MGSDDYPATICVALVIEGFGRYVARVQPFLTEKQHVAHLEWA
jgi:hypothetical protein